MSPDPGATAQALPDASPTVWLGVPQVWHKIKAGIETKLGEATGIRRRLALWAPDPGVRAVRQTLAGKSLPTSLAIRRTIADYLVLAKVRDALGLDQLRWGVTAAAPIPVETLEFFWAGHSRLRSVGVVGEHRRRDIQPTRCEQDRFSRESAARSRDLAGRLRRTADTRAGRDARLPASAGERRSDRR